MLCSQNYSVTLAFVAAHLAQLDLSVDLSNQRVVLPVASTRHELLLLLEETVPLAGATAARGLLVHHGAGVDCVAADVLLRTLLLPREIIKPHSPLLIAHIGLRLGLSRLQPRQLLPQQLNLSTFLVLHLLRTHHTFKLLQLLSLLRKLSLLVLVNLAFQLNHFLLECVVAGTVVITSLVGLLKLCLEVGDLHLAMAKLIPEHREWALFDL